MGAHLSAIDQVLGGRTAHDHRGHLGGDLGLELGPVRSAQPGESVWAELEQPVERT